MMSPTRSERRGRSPVFVAVLALAFWLAACGGANGRPPEGWSRVGTEQFSILLPDSWEAHPITAENAQAEFGLIEGIAPFFATSVGSPEGLQRFSLWAFDTAGEPPAFRDLMNVSAIPTEGEAVEDLGEILDLLEAEYARGGAHIITSELYQIGEMPALRVAYTFRTLGASGELVTIEGRQYFLVAMENIWILSFLVDPDHLAEAAEVIERSAASFQAAR